MPHKTDCAPKAPRTEAITGDLVERLLRQAKAPEPWAGPEKLVSAAGLLASAAELSAGLPKPIADHMARMRRAQKAVDELRRVLPELIGFHLSSAMQPGLLSSPDATLDHADKAKVLLAMQRALTNVEPSIPLTQVAKLLTGWHTAAAMAHLAYLSVVGQGSPSKGGPGARFVQLALMAVGWGEHSLSAIESALACNPLTADGGVEISG